MADLSAVLRKTIDGLPKASPHMRAKVYEKARAAIARQIETANPPLSDEVIEARRSAIEDAIDRTEDHYLEREASAGPSFEPAPQPVPPPSASPRAVLPRTDAGPQGALPQSSPQSSPSQSLPKPSWPTPEQRAAGARQPPAATPRRDPVSDMRVAPPVQSSAPRTGAGAGSVAGPLPRSAAGGRDPSFGEMAPRQTVPAPARREATNPVFVAPRTNGETEPSLGFDTSDIPAADTAAPRYSAQRRPLQQKRSKAPVIAGPLILLLAGAGAAGYVYRDDMETLISGLTGGSLFGTATQTATSPAAPGGTKVAAVPPAARTTTAPAASTQPAATAAAPAATAPAASATRRFTQRLMPDGTEVDEGPGAGNANAFEEGTDVAAASPESLVPPVVPEVSTPEVAETAPAQPEPEAAASVPEQAAPAAAAQPATPPASQTAAATAGAASTTPAVAQKAMYYEERSQTEEGTQQGGNVVWSVVNEPPGEGQPPEPAIRAVADLPDKNLKLTMTIRRNADPTLPASHVIELMFDVPPGFTGGQISNVQRLALKPTEEARGEPLIGVAGKISDGFFIIALNNLPQAAQTNLDLLGREQWIDIPLAYTTGRRALLSIEKGIPGERVFKQAMDAWAAKTQG